VESGRETGIPPVKKDLDSSIPVGTPGRHPKERNSLPYCMRKEFISLQNHKTPPPTRLLGLVLKREEVGPAEIRPEKKSTTARCAPRSGGGIYLEFIYNPEKEKTKGPRSKQTKVSMSKTPQVLPAGRKKTSAQASQSHLGRIIRKSPSGPA